MDRSQEIQRNHRELPNFDIKLTCNIQTTTITFENSLPVANLRLDSRWLLALGFHLEFPY